MLLLEAVDIYGPGNWQAVTEHVGSKSKDQCFGHWFSTYINHDACPLPRSLPEMAMIDIKQYIEDAKQVRHNNLVTCRCHINAVTYMKHHLLLIVMSRMPALFPTTHSNSGLQQSIGQSDAIPSMGSAKQQRHL